MMMPWLIADILSIIDLSTFDNNDDFVYGKAPEYITKDKVGHYSGYSA